MASIVYNRGAFLFSTGLDFETADLRVLLLKNTYTPDKDENTVDQIAPEELSGGTYARQLLANATATQDDAANAVVLDADDTVFPALSNPDTPQFAVVYLHDAGGDASSQLICCIDLGAPDPPDGSDYPIAWNASGICRLGTGA